MKTVALGLAAALLCAVPAVADPPRFIHAQPQAAVLQACEEALGEPAFHCATFLGDGTCIMLVPLGLDRADPVRFEEVLAELRRDCAARVAAR